MAPWSSFIWGSSAKDTASTPQAPQEKDVTARPAMTPSTALVTAETTPRTPDATISAAPESALFSRRSLRQLGMFFGGATLLALSVMVSRRSVIRHTTASQLRFYQQNHWSEQAVGKDKNRKDPTVALEALNLATLNVVSFAIMFTGGLSFAFDISSMEELRAKARKTLFEGTSNTEVDAAAEREVAEWLSKVLKVQIPDGPTAEKEKKQQEDKPSKA
jgi:hypothetical protein